MPLGGLTLVSADCPNTGILPARQSIGGPNRNWSPSLPDESAVFSPPQSHEAASLLALSGWSYVLDRILASVCHDLNGRVSSLQALTQLMELGETLPETLNAEPAKLESIVRLLALIPAYLGAEPSPIRMQDLLSSAMDLHGKVRSAMEEQPPSVEFLDGVPPVLVNESRAVRGMVLLLDHSMRSSPEPGVSVRVGGDESMATVGLPLGAVGVQDEDSLEPLTQLFEMDGGELEVEARTLVLRLPSVAAARAAGR